VVLTTNTLIDFTVVEVPLGVYPAAQQTNVASGIVAMVAANQNTNVIPESAIAVSTLVGLTANQGIPGRKDLTNAFQQIYGAFATWAALWLFPSSSNSVASINAPYTGSGGGTNQLFSTSSGWSFASPVQLGGNLTIGPWAINGTAGSMNASGFFGTGTGVTNLDGGNILASTVSSPQLNTNGLRFLGTNTFPAGSDIAFGWYELSSLGNGINDDIVVGTNVSINVSGPSAAFSIRGMAGGRDGKVIEILNLTTFNMTIAVEGGATGNDPIAANRIVGMTGADEATTGNGFARFKYKSSISRWVLTDLKP
jgi:hypothetical protein